MFRKTTAATFLLAGACFSMPAQHDMHPQTPTLQGSAHDEELAIRIPNLGDGGIDAEIISTRAKVAFENGVRLNNAFAEDEAIRAFRLAERLDPTCAMCYWGEATALAPTINYRISDKAAAQAVTALDKAESLSTHLSSKGQAIIRAERQRYALSNGIWKVDDAAEWTAASKLATQYPNDDALQVNAANAALIDAENGRPGSATADNPLLSDADRLLQRVLQRAPNYTPAIHLFLHLTEWQGRPEASRGYADRLASLAPASGHMLHMASHIDYHLGRYEVAAHENMRAVDADIDYVKRIQPPGGMQAIPMHQHNLTYGLVAALLSGDKTLSLAFAREMQASAPEDGLSFAESYLAFGRLLPPGEMLKMPSPRAPLPQAFYHFALGEAYAQQNDSGSVLGEASKIESIQKSANFGGLDPRVVAMLTVAAQTLEGQAAMVRKDYAKAVEVYGKAASFAEENDPYLDPQVWPWSPRRSLAEALLLQGQPQSAQQEARSALKARPDDPITLTVLAKTEQALGDQDAPRDQERAIQSWHGPANLLLPPMI